jgi:hypothetical protein
MNDAKELHAELARYDELIADEIANHARQMTPLRFNRERILLELAFLHHKVKPGVRVIYRSTVYEITRVDTDFCWGDCGPERMAEKKPWVYGRMIRKDGTRGIVEFRLYSEWTVE